jgi:hypothetical protein
MATTAPPAQGLQRRGPFAGYAPAEHRPLGSAAETVSDFLQQAYIAVEKRA